MDTLIKNRNLADAINALGELETQRKDGKVIREVKLRPEVAGRVRYNIARTMHGLRKQWEAFNEIRQALELEAAAITDAEEKKRFYAERIKPALDAEETVDVRRVKLSDLDLSVNELPGWAVGLLLDWFIEDDQPAA